MSLKSGMHILQSWTFSGDKPALGVLIWHSYRFTLFRRCLLILNSTPSTWKQRSDSEVHVDFTGGREHHHNSTSDTWKNHSTGLCSGNGVGIKLRSSCSPQAQDRRTGCGPRRKASSTIHSSVNGFSQEHISSTCDTVRKQISKPQKIWLWFFFLWWALLRSTLLIFSFYLLPFYDHLVVVAGLRLSLVSASRARLQLCWMGSVLRWRLLRRGTSSKAGVLPRLRQAGSVTAAHGLAAPQHVCSSAVPGIKPPSPALPGAFLTRRPPGTPSLGTF